MTLQIEIGLIRDALRQSYYPVLIMICLNLIFLILAVAFKRKERLFQVLIVYAAFTLINDFYCLIQPVISESKPKADNAAIGYYVCVEFMLFFAIFYFHFKQGLVRKRILTTAIIFGLFFAVATLYHFYYSTRIQARSFEGYLSVSAGMLQIIVTLYYYITLLTEPPTANLIKESHFWIMTGIFSVQSINIPLFLIEQYLQKTFPSIFYYLYSINYVAYSVLFLLFIIAVTCNTRFSRK